MNLKVFCASALFTDLDISSVSLARVSVFHNGWANSSTIFVDEKFWCGFYLCIPLAIG